MNRGVEAEKRLSYARGYYELGMYREAFGEMRRYAQLVQLNRETALFALKVCECVGDWSQLSGIAEYVGNRVPASMPEALVYQVKAEFRRGNVGVALSLLDEGIRRESKSSQLWYELARLFCLIRCFGLVGRAMAKVVSLDPSMAESAIEDPDFRDYVEGNF